MPHVNKSYCAESETVCTAFIHDGSKHGHIKGFLIVFWILFISVENHMFKKSHSTRYCDLSPYSSQLRDQLVFLKEETCREWPSPIAHFPCLPHLHMFQLSLPHDMSDNSNL